MRVVVHGLSVCAALQSKSFGEADSGAARSRVAFNHGEFDDVSSWISFG